MISRRTGSVSSAASLGGRALGIPQVIRPVGNLQVASWRFYSNESLKRAGSKRLSRTWSQRTTETVKAVLGADHYLLAVAVSGLVIWSGFEMAKHWRMEPLPFSRPRMAVESKCDN